MLVSRLSRQGQATHADIVHLHRKLELRPPPAVAVIPLGTGNGLSINFGWGKTMRAEWLESEESLRQVSMSHEMKLVMNHHDARKLQPGHGLPMRMSEAFAICQLVVACIAKKLKLLVRLPTPWHRLIMHDSGAGDTSAGAKAACIFL